MKTQSVYLQAVDFYVSGDIRKLNRYFDHEELSLAEKRLLRVRKAFHAVDYNEARAILSSFYPSEPFLRGEWHFLSGNLHSYLSDWSAALIDAHQALQRYTQCAHQRGLFLSCYNLSVYYNRVGLDAVSLHFLNQALPFVQSVTQESLVLRAQACHHSRSGDFKMALGALELAMKSCDLLPEIEQATLLSVAADIYFRAGRTEQAADSLSRLIVNRLVRDRARVQFEFLILKDFVARRPLARGVVPVAIEEANEYRLRWLVLADLQDGDLTSAKKRWCELCSLLPSRYQAEFKCVNPSDEKTIFISALRGLMTGNAMLTQAPPTNLSGKQQRLFEVMVNSPIALRKEELIERVWGMNYDPSLDSRFYKLIERIRSNAGIKIESHQSTYRIAR